MPIKSMEDRLESAMALVDVACKRLKEAIKSDADLVELRSELLMMYTLGYGTCMRDMSIEVSNKH